MDETELHPLDCALRLARGETVEVVAIRRLKDGAYRCYLADYAYGVYADIEDCESSRMLWRCFGEGKCCTIPMPPENCIGFDEADSWAPVL